MFFLTLHNERGGVQALPLGDFIIANRSALMRLVAPATCVAGEGPLKYVAYADIYIYIYIMGDHEAIVTVTRPLWETSSATTASHCGHPQITIGYDMLNEDNDRLR